MTTKNICNKCGKEVYKSHNGDCIYFLRGSLQLLGCDMDLCDDCFKKLKAIIKDFQKENSKQ